MIRIAILMLALLTAASASADEEFICARGDLERIISVVYLSDGPLPCQVTYDKGQGAEVLWSAENTEGYCEARARDFVAKQEQLGFSCRHTTASGMGNGMMDDQMMDEGMMDEGTMDDETM